MRTLRITGMTVVISKLVLGCCALAVSNAVYAQTLEVVSALPPSGKETDQLPPATESTGQEAVSCKLEFTNLDGSPLPPEVQALLRQQYEGQCVPGGASTTSNQSEIVVAGERPRRSLTGNIPPKLSLDNFELKTYGASNVDELINSLGPQVKSGRGKEGGEPVVLLNGKRTSGFADIARIPIEAIERVDVYPEEVALRYGYRSDQKVINVVTFLKFKSYSGQLTYSAPTDGGKSAQAANANHIRINDDTRFGFDVTYDTSSALLASERDIVQCLQITCSGRFRTLLPSSERVALSSTLSGVAPKDVAWTVSANFTASDSEYRLGFGSGGLVIRRSDSQNLRLGTTLGGSIRKWQWSLTGVYERNSIDIATSDTTTRNVANFVNTNVRTDLTLTGSPLSLPAGPIWTSLNGRIGTTNFNSESVQVDAIQNFKLSRNTGSIELNVDIPFANREKGVLPWFGYLSGNVNAEIQRISDVGSLSALDLSVYWSPFSKINIIASFARQKNAPTIDQVGLPIIITPNVITYDYTRNEVVYIPIVSGGNRSLQNENRRVLNFGINTAPFSKQDLAFSIDYLKEETDQPVTVFPSATPQFEAAFPRRFERDSDGRLLRVDSRPLNLRRSIRHQLRWGINFTRPLEAGAQNSQTISVASVDDIKRRSPGAKIIMAEPGSSAARRIENMTSRLVIGLYHTINLKDRVVLKEGDPAVDSLDSSGNSLFGGKPNHEVEIEVSAFKRGLGGRLTANWQSRSNVEGLATSTGPQTAGLSFSSYGTVNISFFLDPESRVGEGKNPAWIKGIRVSLGLKNIFDSRPHVRDFAGVTPLAYQSAYLDPLGRSVFLNIRKIF